MPVVICGQARCLSYIYHTKPQRAKNIFYLLLPTSYKKMIPTRWTLQELLASPTGEPLAEALAELEAATAVLEAWRPALNLTMTGADFRKMWQDIEHFTCIVFRLGQYGSLWFTEDTQNQAALSFMGQMDERLTQIQNRILFIELWWKGLPDETVSQLLEHVGDVRYYLEKERLLKEHILAEPEEKIINLKNVNGSNALVTLYDMITSKFVFELEIAGEKKFLTRSELSSYVHAPEANMRQAAYQELYRVYQREATVLAQIYIHRVRDWANEYLTMRHFAMPIDFRNRSNDIPNPVVDTLLAVCAEQAPVFQRYFRLKAGWLDLPGKLSRYDLYAPLTMNSTQKIPYSQAVDMVLDSFEQFSPAVAELARRIFADNHIDAEIRPHKQNGAFCASVLPGMTPWVLMNYNGEPREVATLAHELGHAIHALLAADHSVLTFHSALPMAETASVFAETLLTHRLLAETNDPATRRDLLAKAVDDTYATVLRQAYFVLFEREAHQMIAEGKTIDDLHQYYLRHLAQQFGDAVEIGEEFQYEWVSIPHFYHVPFYCYAYSFGQLLALSLYQQYQKEGDSFKPKFLKILSYGASASPNHILTEAGINIADADFWRGGFKVIEAMIAELEANN